MLGDPTFWALAALVVFVAIVLYLKVPAQLGKTLDNRSQRIRDELEEARRLREEAQELLADYQRRRKEAEQEAEDIVAAARHEAELMAEDAARKTAEFIARRTTMAEQKIEQAEADAVSEVRASAVDLAVAAAETIIRSKASGELADDLIAGSIGEVKSKLH